MLSKKGYMEIEIVEIHIPGMATLPFKAYIMIKVII
jgi:hypothetical protein